MKLVNMLIHGHAHLGVRMENGGILPVTELAPIYGIGSRLPRRIEDVLHDPSSLGRLRDRLEQNPSAYADKIVPAARARLLPAVSHPAKIVCIGLNYRRHAQETGAPIPESPVVFSKFSDAVAAHGDVIPLPAGAEQIDFEGELAIVIGRYARDVKREEALDYALGYTVANDVSARDLQMRTSQWLLGKTCPKFAPLGPDLATADEIPDPNALRIRTLVNGVKRQDSSTSDMIFSCAELIHYLSRYMTLAPGDVILTGTPEGVILGDPADKRVWLKDGDEVTIEIEGIGTLGNRFARA